MRLSIDENDSGFVWAKTGIVPFGVEIWLDGQKLAGTETAVVTADEENGYIVRYVRSASGITLHDDVDGEVKPRREVVEGKVEIFLVETECWDRWMHQIPRPESGRMRAKDLELQLAGEASSGEAATADSWAKHLRF
jgi:hypothetical protein